MLKFTKDSFVDVDEYDAHLHRNGYILYNREKMEDIYYYENAKKLTYKNLAIDVMAHHSNGFYSTLDKEPLHKYLTLRYCFCSVLILFGACWIYWAKAMRTCLI
jgi:hypothetical protein